MMNSKSEIMALPRYAEARHMLYTNPGPFHSLVSACIGSRKRLCQHCLVMELDISALASFQPLLPQPRALPPPSPWFARKRY
jgi:hypothetical protein